MADQRFRIADVDQSRQQFQRVDEMRASGAA